MNNDPKPKGVEHWRGAPYLKREGAAQTYKEARARVRKMQPPPKNWRDYLDRCRDYGLPTEPHKLWPEEFEKGGRYAGYLGTGAPEADVKKMISAQEARAQLGVGKEVFSRLVQGLMPDASVSHKHYYRLPALRKHLRAVVKDESFDIRKDARERVRKALPKLHAGRR